MVSCTVHPEGPFVFEGPRDNSPLTAALFPLKIRKLMVAGNVITVWKNASDHWRTLAPLVGKELRNILVNGGSAIDPQEAGEIPDPLRDSQLTQAIQKVLEAQVNWDR